MSVEIKELVIRAVAQPDKQERQPQSARNPDSVVVDRQAIVDAAVHEVLRILRASRER